MSLGRHANDLMTSFYVRTPQALKLSLARVDGLWICRPASQLVNTAKPVFGATGRRGAFGSRHARAYLSRLGVVLPS